MKVLLEVPAPFLASAAVLFFAAPVSSQAVDPTHLRMLQSEKEFVAGGVGTRAFAFDGGTVPEDVAVRGAEVRKVVDGMLLDPHSETVEIILPAAGIVSDPCPVIVQIGNYGSMELDLYWIDSKGRDIGPRALASFGLRASKEFKVLRAKLTGGADSAIAGLRLRFGTVGQPITLRSISLIVDTTNLGFRETVGLRPMLAKRAGAGEMLAWTVRVPPAAMLIFSTAHLPERFTVTTEGEASFVVRAQVEGRGAEEIYRYDQKPTADRRGFVWKDHKVDLEEFAGREMKLILATEAPKGVTTESEGRFYWGDPVIHSPRDPTPPNVILIGIDTFRQDKVGSYGNLQDLTPNIDRLASDGVLFENMISTSSWTLPSFASMYTSLYPSTHMAGFRPPLLKRDALEEDPEPAGLTDSVVTLAEILRGAGFRTACFHDNLFLSGDFNMDQGMQVVRHQKEGAHSVALALGEARDHIDRPFFLFLHLMEPHKEYDPPPEYRRKYLPKELPDGEEGTRLLARRLYDGEVAYTDELVGRFLEGLDDFGLRQNSLVVFTADHGEGFWEHYEFAKTHYTDKRVKNFGEGHGYNLFGETIDLPLIMRFPGRIEAGSRSEERASLIDVAPTILDWVGIEAPEQFAGRSLRAGSLRGTSRGYDFVESFSRWGLDRQSYYEGDWKIIAELSTDFVELYNLREDPTEMNDLSRVEPARARRMVSRLKEILAEAEALRGALRLGEPPVPALSEDARKELEALGYVD